jgi:predicted aspartyl protease
MVNNNISKSIDILFEAYRNKDLELLKPYLANDIAVAGYRGKLAITLIDASIHQLKPISTYSIISSTKKGEYYNVQVNHSDSPENPYEFVMSADGKFIEINMLKIHAQEYEDNAKARELNTPVSLPFQYMGDLIIIKAGINQGKDTLNFVFDSGASTLVLDKKTSEKFDLVNKGSANAKGASGNSNYELVNLSIHSKELRVDNALTALVDLSHLSSEIKIDGIIGATFINSYVTQIDYANQKINFYNDISDIDFTYVNKIDFTFDNGIRIPQIEATIQLKNGKIYIGKFLIDTGADLSIMLNTNFIEKHKITEQIDKKIEVSYGSLTKNNSKSFEGTIESIIIGNFALKDIPVNLTNEKKGVNSFQGYVGIIGNDILKRFDLVFDYKNKTLYLPANYFFTTAFQYPSAGFDIKLEDHKMIAKDIIEGTKIFKKGLKQGDEIIDINGLTSDKISTIKKLLKTEELRLKIRYINSNGEVKTTRIRTQRLI